MAPKQDEPVEEGDDDSLDDDMAGLHWVPKTVLETITAKLEKKEEISKESIEQLIEVDEPADDLAMVPVDLSDCAEIDEDDDNLIEKLGAAKVAELFVQGRKKFLESLANMPAEAKANTRQEMTGEEYKKMIEEFGDSECGESELDEDDEEEEDGDEDDEEQAEEPPAKKSKTE
eukprot:CAMPEP_0171233824 /NCGR_PEP_ID=MMETSP0790-20130122/41117_1 /TAXON_ID=2925 /ORGANISM="Alexandrium catenella, Strain OF101" /LENGTH=173 /DNA_ID=CAMNT_0011700091 /DNA_START=68 /DNA_END=589 /DNA_ORIENTATION=+